MIKKRYEVTLLVDASKFVEIEASSPEEAADLADAKYGHVSLCNQCTDEIETGDVYGAHVYLNGEQVADTTRAGELRIQLAALKEEFAAFKLATAETAQVYIERIDSIKEENERLREARLAPVLYQYRMRPTWEKDSKFCEWDECSEASYVQYQNQRIYGDWEYQSRALYSSAPDLDALKTRVAELEQRLENIFFEDLEEPANEG